MFFEAGGIAVFRLTALPYLPLFMHNEPEIERPLPCDNIHPMTIEDEVQEPSDKKNTHATIIGTWFKSEMFWMGVAASTLSTGIIAVGVVVAALVTGLVDLKSAIVTLLSFIAVISVTAILVWLIPAARRGLDRLKSTIVHQESKFSIAFAVLSAFVSVLSLILTHFIGGS